jgi:hypothetical protein
VQISTRQKEIKLYAKLIDNLEKLKVLARIQDVFIAQTELETSCICGKIIIHNYGKKKNNYNCETGSLTERTS